MTAHHMRAHHTTWLHHLTWRHITSHHVTSHHIAWHDISQLTALPHLTSPPNQPHKFVSDRSQPHDITYRITSHYITTTDIPPKPNEPQPKRHHQTEQLQAGAPKKLGLGIALVDCPVCILPVNSVFGLIFFLWKLPPQYRYMFLKIPALRLQKSLTVYLHQNMFLKFTVNDLILLWWLWF